MVILGALLGKTNLLEKEAVLDVVRAITKKPELLELNIKAVNAGFEFAHDKAVEETLWAV
jgi:Pyruvate/2-oxoacid:ferredoxin oxidoreductase gamma subunit